MIFVTKEDNIDVLGINSDESYIVKYENGHMVNMVSSAGKEYYLIESKNIIDEIKKCELYIKARRENIENLIKQIKTIESLKL